MTRRLLIAYAHPDDESFGLGGLITRYVEEGVEVYLICATNGDQGTIPPNLLAQYNSVAELRLAELDCAAEKLQFKEVFKLGYKDSGMMGSKSTEDPDCLWQADQNDLQRRVVEIIRDIKPQVIITFNKYGGYGHPDHIAIQRATTAAFDLAGQADYDTGQPVYQPQKLYYSGVPRNYLRFNMLWLRLKGKNPRKLGKNADVDMMAVLENAEPIHTLIDIRDYYEVWEEVSRCHASQISFSSRTPLYLRRLLVPRQGFTRVHPKSLADRPDETNMFAGVTLAEPERELIS